MPSISNTTIACTTESPLSGVRVLDFTILMAGPMCTRMLADAGADIIKVEQPSGDTIRQRPPFSGHQSTYFGALNCGKRSIVLDLKSEAGRGIAMELALQADVVVENFRPGVMQRLGLDYATLAHRKPDLIYCSISGFGQHGELASIPSVAPVIHAFSGYDAAHAAYQGSERKPPSCGIFVADTLGGLQAAYAIQLALYHKERRRVGQYIDVSLLESTLAMLVYETQAAQAPPKSQRQVYQPFRTLDGHVMIAAVTEKIRQALFSTIGRPDAKLDPRFSSETMREQHGAALHQMIEAWTMTHTSVECELLLLEAGVPCARYRQVAETLAEPHLRARGTLATIKTDEGSYDVAGPAFLFSHGTVRINPKVAVLGEHTREVLSELLGYTPELLDQLASNGTFGKALSPSLGMSV